jgi:crotonobetainyl-CoA:carnitine CoA-transferase CaiB-like acyl-CoA transferase
MGWMCGYRDAKPIVRSTCDPIAGMHAALAFLAALDHRDRTGQGQMIELPMVEVALQVTAEQTATWSADGFLLERDGNRGPYAAPQGVYPCIGDEQWVAVSIAEDHQWRALVRVIGDDRLARPELEAQAARHAHHDLIDEVIAVWTRGRDRDATVQLLRDAGVPAAPVWNQSFIDDIPQLAARGYWQQVSHPVVSPLQLPATGMWSTTLDLAYRRGAPLLGEHTDEVLLGAGIDAAEVQRLRDLGVVG